MKKKKYIIYISVVLIAIITMIYLVTNTNAESVTREATVQEIKNEKNFVRMTASLSRAKDTNNKINKDTLAIELDKYAGIGKTSVTQKSTNRLIVRFIETGNEYELDIDTGVMLYTITYDANEGSGAPESQTKYDGIDLKLSETIPTRTNYTFLGWSTNPNAVTATYRMGELYTDNTSITLYAVWNLNALPVTYYADTDQMYVEDVIIGETALEPTTFTPVKDSWTFVGWKDNTTADGNVLTEKNMETEALTLYALYKQELTLSYNGNGATGGSTASQTGNRYYNAANTYSNLTFALRANGFSRSGYSFTGWDLGAVGANVTLTSNKTAKAQWKQNKAPQPNSTAPKVTCNNGPEAKGSVTINCTGWSTLTFTINMTAWNSGGYSWCNVNGTSMSSPWGTSGSKNASYSVSGKSSVTINYSAGGYADVWLTNIRLN